MEEDSDHAHLVTPRRKKYVTRACDACKKRKSKCDGREPCSRCINSEIACGYVSSYNRVRGRGQNGHGRQLRDRHQRGHARYDEAEDTTVPRQTPVPLETLEASTPMQMEDDADAGDASVHAFLRRVSAHLSLVGQGLPRYLFKREEEAFGGSDDIQSLVFPVEATAKQYLECFFEHANVTYRYVHRDTTIKLLDQVLNDDDSVLQDHTKMSVLLLAMGLGCIWTASRRNEPLSEYKRKARKLFQAAQTRLNKVQMRFPPSLGVVQAHILKCQVELASNRFNSAWMTLGTAVRLGQMIDIQRELQNGDPIEAFCRKGAFWAMYMVDRYLSASLGRPMIIRDCDVTVSLPSSQLDPRVGMDEAKIAAGVNAHARLAQIAGDAIIKLYPGARSNAQPRENVVRELEAALQAWLRETPAFFHPQEESVEAPTEGYYDVRWIFKRQQRTVRAAYYFTNMLIYRGHLLMEFLHQAPSTPVHKPPTEEIQRCLENAMAMANLAGIIADDTSYNAVYWTTSYFIFCAISILIVYLALYQESPNRSIIETAVEKAMRGHHKLNHTTDPSIQKLLEESRSRVKKVRSAGAAPGAAATETPSTTMEAPPDTLRPDMVTQTAEDFSLGDVTDVWNMNHQTEMFGGLTMPHDWNMLGDASGFGMIMDIGFDNTMPLSNGLGVYPEPRP